MYLRKFFRLFFSMSTEITPKQLVGIVTKRTKLSSGILLTLHLSNKRQRYAPCFIPKELPNFKHIQSLCGLCPLQNTIKVLSLPSKEPLDIFQIVDIQLLKKSKTANKCLNPSLTIQNYAHTFVDYALTHHLSIFPFQNDVYGKKAHVYGRFFLCLPHFQRWLRVQLVQNLVGLYPQPPLKMWEA